jgi:hypothetical protein
MAATGPLTSARCRLATTSAHVTGAAAACTDDASELRALHTADLHFDPASGRSVAELLPLILDAARDEGCSLLLLAGDVFDNGRVSEGEVLLFLSMLQAAGENDGLQAVLLPGNHDVDIFGASNSDAVRRAIPASVTLLASEGGDTVEVIVAGGQLVTVFGKPVFNHAPSFHPLGDLPPRPSTSDYHIVLGHGLVLDDGFGEGRSSPIAKSHLSGADCDYIALGHVRDTHRHTQQTVASSYLTIV